MFVAKIVKLIYSPIITHRLSLPIMDIGLFSTNQTFFSFHHKININHLRLQMFCRTLIRLIKSTVTISPSFFKTWWCFSSAINRISLKRKGQPDGTDISVRFLLVFETFGLESLQWRDRYKLIFKRPQRLRGEVTARKM